MKTIILTVAKDGSTRIETKGFAGSSCQAASNFVEVALSVRQASQNVVPVSVTHDLGSSGPRRRVARGDHTQNWLRGLLVLLSVPKLATLGVCL